MGKIRTLMLIVCLIVLTGSFPVTAETAVLNQTAAIGISSGQPEVSYSDCRVGYNSSNGDGVAISFYKFTLPTITNAVITSITFDYAACGWRPDGQSGPLRNYAKYITNDSWTTSTTWWNMAPVTDYWAITGVGQSPEWTNYAYTGWSWTPDPDPIDVTSVVVAAEGYELNGQEVSFAGMVTGGWTPYACDGYEARYDTATLIVTYVIATAVPTFSRDQGLYSQSQSIAISCATPGATIRYTTTGTDPDVNSTVYTTPVLISSTTTLKAKAWSTSYEPSPVKSATYTFPAYPDDYSRAVKIPYGKATINGDLSDWPALTSSTIYDSNDPENLNRVWVPLDQEYWGMPTDIVNAYYAARWSSGKVYVAIMVNDSNHYFSIEPGNVPVGMWDNQDAAGVSIHTTGIGDGTYSSTQAKAQQYTFGPSVNNSSVAWSCLGDAISIPTHANFLAACCEVGDWIYYEVAITPFKQFDLNTPNACTVSTLKTGDVIGLDAAASTFNSSNEGGVMSENTIGGEPDWNKWNNYNAFGIHILAQGPISGDANEDGMVNVSDLSLLAANYGTASGATWGMGDFTGDGAVNVSDLSLLAANYGTNSTSTLSWADAYAQAFGTTVVDGVDDDVEETGSSLCSGLGLSLIAGLALMGLMLVKLEE